MCRWFHMRSMYVQGACLSVDATPSGDWVVAGCHDASTHIFHFKRTKETGIELEVSPES